MAKVSKKKRNRKKKGGRLNKRLLMIVSLTTVIVVGIAAGLIFLRMKGSVSRNLHAGRTHLQDGKWEQAQRAFGRVVKKDPANEEGMNGLMDVYDKWVPETREHANQLQIAFAQAILHDTEYHPGDDERALRAIEFLHEEARAMNLDGQWEALQTLADKVHSKFGDDSEAGQRALYYKALTRLRLESEHFTRDRDDEGNVIFPGEVELKAYLALRPGDDDGMAQLAFGRMAVARRLGLEEQFQQEKRNLALAEETFQEALAANPRGVATQLSHVRHLILHELITEARRARQVGTLSSEERDAILAELAMKLDLVEEMLRSDPDVNPLYLAEFFQFVEIGDEERGNERIRDLAEHYLKTNPGDDLRRLELAEALRKLEEFDEAMVQTRAVLDADDRSVAHGAARQHLVRAMAAKKLLEIASAKWGLAEADSARRDEAIEDATEARDALVHQLQGEESGPLVIEADGRLAFMRGDYREAARLLGQLTRGRTISPELLRINAMALDEINQPGEAAERLREAVRLNPVSTSSRAMLARVLARMRLADEALQVLSGIPQNVMDANADIASLQQSILAMKSIDQGEAVTNLNSPVLIAIMEADGLQREGRVEEALEGLQAVVQTTEESDELVPALVAAAQLHSSLDQQAEAAELIERARAIRPDDDRLEQLAVAISIEDPIERIRNWVAQQESDQESRDVMLLVTFDALAGRQMGQAARLDRMGEAALAEEARLLGERATAAADELRDQVSSSASSDAGVFLMKFNALLQSGDLDEAEAMLSEGREANADQAGGHLLESELLIAKYRQAEEAGDPAAEGLGKRAVDAARRATQESDWLTGAWRQLGRVLRLTGDVEESRLAWAEAWRRNPAESATVRAYAQVLLEPGGDPLQAAKILREAARNDRSDRTLVEDWLAVEATFGDKGIALIERDRIYEADPSNRANMLQYASLLTSLEPSFELLSATNEDGPIGARQWLGLSADEQQSALDALEATWDKQARTLCDALAETDDSTIQHAFIHASVLSQLGRRADMLSRLARFVDRTDASPDRDPEEEALSAAQFLINTGRDWEAAEFLVERRDLQGDSGRIDGAIGTIYASIGRPSDAEPLLRSAVEAGVEGIPPRLVEVLLQLQRIDEAEAVVEQIRADAPGSYEVAMLDARLHRTRQAQAEGVGNAAAANAARVAYREALEEASRRDPEQVTPFLELIASMIREYRRTIDRSVLESALRYADAASEIRSDVSGLAVQRALVLEAMGEPRQAANDLDSFLRRNPGADDARVALAQMHVAAGTPERARTVLEDAIVNGANPSFWRERLAEHMMSHVGDRVAASQLLARAWSDEPTDERLYRLVSITRTHEPWGHEAVYQAIQKNQGHLEHTPTVRGLLARAQGAQGLRDHARETLRETWTAYQRSIADGASSPSELRRWFEDAYVVFRGSSGGSADAFIDQVVGSADDPIVLAGRSHFLALRNQPGDDSRGIAYLQQGLDQLQGVDRLPLLNQLGSMQLRSGRDDDAVTTFTEIVELQPSSAVALNNLAWLLATLKDDPEAALPLARRAIELDSRQPNFLDTMVEVQSRLGNHDAAMTARLSRLRIQPNNPHLLKEIAVAYLEQHDDPAKARPYAERVLSLVPRDATALDLAGWIDFKDGRVARAEDRLKQSIRRSPTAEAHLHLAQVLADQGRVAPALDQLRQAEALSSTEAMREAIKRLRTDLEGTG
ncbi:MAG: tetratricopeptide repeat protein [Phycisphaerales bacterium]|nr:tetratricopeptide repeat protein [Phycisphaerales bacterium]